MSAHMLGEVAGGVGSVDEERDDREKEENERRAENQEKPIISEKEYEIAEGLNRLKEWIDEMVFFNQGILANEAAFDRDVLSLVSAKLLEMDIASSLQDRRFIQHQIADEYYLQYEQMNNNAKRIPLS